MNYRPLHGLVLAAFMGVAPARADQAFSQQAFFKSSNNDPDDRFGETVAISGNIIAVGAPGEDSSASGINGPKNNDPTGSGRGAVYIFSRSGLTWTETAYLKAGNPPADPRTNHLFGKALAMSGNTVVVGAPGEESTATGVNGDSTNQDSIAGAAYVFVLNNGVWTQQAYLKASNTGYLDEFGGAVAIDGDIVVVGATGEDGSSTTINGPDNNLAPESGAAYVYERTGTTWALTATLKAPNAQEGDLFGSSIAVSGNTIVIGAWNEDGSARTVNGAFNNDAETGGAAYVFEKVGGVWTYHSYLKSFNLDPEDRFGTSVAIDGDRIMVGAFSEDSSSRVVNGPDNNDIGFDGAVYEFIRIGGVWWPGDYIKPSGYGPAMSFGWSVALDGDRMIATGKSEMGSSTGVDGHTGDLSGFNSGAAYLFERINDTWTQIHYFKASNTRLQNEFGESAALSGRTAIIGSALDDANSRGINADQTQGLDNNLNAGAAYVFHRPTEANLSIGNVRKFPTTAVRKTSRPQRVTITNTGELDLPALSIAATGPAARDFLVSRPAQTGLAGGASTKLDIRFRPKRAGNRKATFEASGSGTSVSVAMSGRGKKRTGGR